MLSHAPLSIAPLSPHIECVEGGGCSYLRALSTIEHIAGFEHTACRYATAAERCQERGCSAAVARADAGRLADAPPPIALDAVRLPQDVDAAAGPSEAEVIPFDRKAGIDIVSDYDGNYVERRALKLDGLPARGDSLGYLYGYWRDLRSASALQFANVDTVHLARAGIIGKLHVVDVSSSDPEDFSYELAGYAIPMLLPSRPCAHPIGIYAESILRDYNTVRLVASPRLDRIRGRIGKTVHHYTRLILPFLGKCQRATHLAVAIRQEPGDGIEMGAR